MLGQLYELKAARNEIESLREWIQRDAELDKRGEEIQAQKDSLTVERLALAKQEVDLAVEKAAMYETLYKAIAAKPGWGCTLKKIVTLGIGRC